MLSISKVHHISIICSDYQKSKFFYTHVLGLEIIQEIYRQERQSYKLDLALNGEYVVELFTFPSPPKRLTQPEATGLRHLAFEVEDIDSACKQLSAMQIETEPIRKDENTNKNFTFFCDPDNLPIELYEK
jgi:glyoxylase I family protein